MSNRGNISTTEIRAARMLDFIKNITPLPRMINSPGLDQTFELVQKELPEIIVHEYPAGMECEDWCVPKSWQVIEGVMRNKEGDTIASIDENLLFVAPYSEPIAGWFTKDEIVNHLRTRPDRPDAFALEHRNAYDYQLVDWGITLPHNRWVDLPDEKYHIKIEVEKKDKPMKVGELFLEGKRPEIICICAHIDELCNDDISGCALGIEIMRSLQSISNRQYCYQLLLVPEMFGTLFFAYNNPDVLKKTIFMFNLEAVGAGENLCIKKGLVENSTSERYLVHAINEIGKKFKKLSFFEGYENDERVYGWPTIGITGISLQRYPFPQYHTSDDTPDIINKEYMIEALNISDQFINILEKDYIPIYNNNLPPWLTKRGVYFDSKDDSDRFHKFNNLILYNIDGQRSVSDLAHLADLNFFEVLNYLSQFLNKNLIKRKRIDW
ncbi:MAG: DUF4910 domain-containing protein [Bacteroidetes bacterium]|nr:DUF4910 domain-containing protein [Bacteroidota bacterium]